jgi:hypothetical protein
MNPQLICYALQQFNVCVNHGAVSLIEKAAKAKNEIASPQGERIPALSLEHRTPVRHVARDRPPDAHWETVAPIPQPHPAAVPNAPRQTNYCGNA